MTQNKTGVVLFFRETNKLWKCERSQMRYIISQNLCSITIMFSLRCNYSLLTGIPFLLSPNHSTQISIQSDCFITQICLDLILQTTPAFSQSCHYLTFNFSDRNIFCSTPITPPSQYPTHTGTQIHLENPYPLFRPNLDLTSYPEILF